jgi:lambda family phage portal protein
MMKPNRRIALSPASAHEQFKSDYQAAKETRFRRRRQGINLQGSGADYHYRNEASYLKVMEYARDMDRNDAIVGSTIDLSTTNIVQGGFTLDVATADKAVDADLSARWKEWAEDPAQCDAAGEMTFDDIEWMTQRQVSLDGDVLALPTVEGALRMVEAHRLRTPSGTKRNVVCGVLLDQFRRRQEYWFTKDDIDPNAPLRYVSDIVAYPARDDEGFRQVFHIYNPKRFSQTRGISALAPIFDMIGMFEDINFATLVKQQINNCFAIFRQMDAGGMFAMDQQQMGEIVRERLADGATRTIEGIAPGMIIQGMPGETLQGFSPNVPNPEWFQHMKFILQIIGVNLGLPLVIVLLDAKETNFSGWRGAVDQARMGWKRNQKALKTKLHEPVYLWKVRQWISEDRILAHAAQRMGKAIFGHNWNTPQWPYIEPLKDAQADALRIEKRLTSPRRLHAQRGQEYPEVIAETIDDNRLMIEGALAAAGDINKKYPEAAVNWRDLIGMSPKDAAGSQPPQESARKRQGGMNDEELEESQDDDAEDEDIQDDK